MLYPTAISVSLASCTAVATVGASHCRPCCCWCGTDARCCCCCRWLKEAVARLCGSDMRAFSKAVSMSSTDVVVASGDWYRA